MIWGLGDTKNTTTGTPRPFLGFSTPYFYSSSTICKIGSKTIDTVCLLYAAISAGD